MRTQINLLSILQWTFFILAGLLFINSVFFNINTSFIFSFREQMVNFLIITIIFYLTACLVYYLTRNQGLDFFQKRYIFVVYGAMSVIFIFQLIYTSLIHSSLEHDVQLIILNAQAGSPHEFVWIDYFSLYPNNFLMLFFFRFIHRALALFNMDGNFIRTLIIVNIVFVNIAVALTFHVVKMAFDVYKAYVAWIFAILLFAFSPWLIVPYSDTLSMPFAIGAIFLYLKSINAEKNKKFGYAIAIGVVAQIGFLLKPSSLIPVIAILIIQVLMDFRLFRSRGKSYKKPIYRSKYIALCIIIGMSITSVLWTSFIHAQNTFPFVPGVSFPAEHWIKMGMQMQPVGDRFSYGAYNADDFFFTASFLTTGEKRAADREVIRERLADFGPMGYIHFLINKARWITCDGTFHWGEFASGDFENITERQLHFRNLMFPRGADYSTFAHFAQGVWLFIWFWYFLFIFIKKNTSCVFTNMCICALTGLVLFILLTEGRSRYLINHLPYFAIISSLCFVSVFQTAQKAIYRLVLMTKETFSDKTA